MNKEPAAQVAERSRPSARPVRPKKHRGPSAWMARRAVLQTTEKGIFSLEDLPYLLLEHEGVEGVSSLGVAIYSPLEGQHTAGLYRRNSRHLRERLEKKTREFPAQQKGFLGKAVVLGVTDADKLGPRYVGYRLSGPLAQVLGKEHRHLQEATDRAGVPYLAHLTVFKTYNHQTALELADEMNGIASLAGESSQEGVPVELGPAQLRRATGNSANAASRLTPNMSDIGWLT